MNEVWFEFRTNEQYQSNVVIAVSNYGRYKRANGEIDYTTYRQSITLNNKQVRLYRIIAEHFIPKTQEDIELGRNEIDHKTHEPDGININDVRNLRWCTHNENMNFEERCVKLSLPRTWKPRKEFGHKFFEHYGKTGKEIPDIYKKEKSYYHNHNKRFSWE